MRFLIFEHNNHECGKDRSPTEGVPKRSAGMEANAGRADSLIFGSLPQVNVQKAAQK